MLAARDTSATAGRSSLKRKNRLLAIPTENLDRTCDPRRWTWPYQRQVVRNYQWLDGVLQQMEPRDAFILRSRYGLAEEGCQAQSLQRLADKLGVSRERVRQLEQRATLRLRALARQDKLEPLP